MSDSTALPAQDLNSLRARRTGESRKEAVDAEMDESKLPTKQPCGRTPDGQSKIQEVSH